MTLDRSILGVLSQGGARVGVAFLVTPDLALTCAHVISRAVDDPVAGTGVRVTLDLPLVPAEPSMPARRTAEAVVERWQPPGLNGGGDIAVLRLLDPLPGGRPARMVEAVDVWGHLIRAFGFPAGREFGVWHTGRLLGRQAAGWIQAHLAEPTGYRVEQGFSGAPAWDDELRGVVGMVVAAETSATPAGYLIPTEMLLGAWPDLRSLVRQPSPYRGLAPFQQGDREVFFGRSREIAELVERMRQPGVVTLVGPSGCGKSSLVFAGVIPELWASDPGGRMAAEPGQTVGLARPAVVAFRPSAGRTAYSALAASMVPLLQPELSEAERLGEVSTLAGVLEEEGLGDVVPRILQRSGASRVVIVVDQAEELLAQHPDQVDWFARHVLGPEAPPELAVLLTLRADFLSTALRTPVLTGALRQSVYTLGAMTAEQLRQVVVRPAESAGVRFQDGLVERILADMGADPGALPLLALTLTLLWERQSGGQLTHEAYDELGRVAGSLARYAEEVWHTSGLADDEYLARHLFTQLVLVAPGGEITRRLATSADLGSEAWELAQRLATSRLLVVGRDAEGRETVELAHEALVDGWSRLGRLVELDREFRLWQEGMRGDLSRWQRADRDAGQLLRGSALAEARRWHGERAGDMSDAEREFVIQSERHERNVARRRRVLSSGIAVVVVVAIVLGSLFVYQRSVARREAAAAASRTLAALSAEWAERDPVHSSLLALAAHQRSPTDEARNALFRQYVDNDDVHAMFSGAPGPIKDAQASADGRVVASLTESGIVTVWSRSPDGAVETRRAPPGLYTMMMRLTADGSTAWLWSLEMELSRLDVATGQVTEVARSDVVPDLFWGGAVSADGAQVAGVFQFDDGGKAIVWDVRSGRQVAELPVTGYAHSLHFSSDGRSLVIVFTAFGNPSGRIEIRDVATGSSRVIPGTVDEAVVPPGAEVAVTCTGMGDRSQLRAVRLADGGDVGHADREGSCLSNMATDPSGRTVVIEGVDDFAVVDLQLGTEIATMAEPSGSRGFMRTLPILVGLEKQLALFDESRVVLVDVPRSEHYVRGVLQARLLPDGRQNVVVVEDGAALRVYRTESDGLVAEAARPAPYWKSSAGELVIGADSTLVADRVAADRVEVRRLPGLESVANVTTRRVQQGRNPFSSVTTGEVNYSMFFDQADRLVIVVGNRAEWWDVTAGRLVTTLDLEALGYVGPDQHAQLAAHPDPTRVGLVVAGRSDVRILSASTGKELGILPVGSDVMAVSFQRDAPYAAILRRSSTIELWDTERRRKVLGPLPSVGYSGPAFTAQFLEGPGEYLVADAGQIKVWQAGSGAPKSSLELGPDRYVMTASADGRVVLYAKLNAPGGILFLNPQVWRDELCKITGRSGFTPDERAGLPAGTPKVLCRR